jgi:hypothetical protein
MRSGLRQSLDDKELWKTGMRLVSKKVGPEDVASDPSDLFDRTAHITANRAPGCANS